MRALVTRPIEDAEPLADALRARGIEPVIEPLLIIKPLPAALPALDGVRALLFTSANGVRAFAAASERRDPPVLAVGPSTADAARAAGFAQVESADGDVSALAERVAARVPPGEGKLLHVAGSAVAGDLSAQLAARGYAVERVALYEAVPADALSPAVADDLAAGRIDWVLLFSPRTAATFARLVRAAGRADALKRCAAVCLSAAVAEAVATLPWHTVRIATKPDQANLLALVENLRAEAAHAAATHAPKQAAKPAPAARGAPLWPAIAAAAATVIVLVGVLGATAPLWRDLVLPAAAPPADTARLDALGARVEQLQRAASATPPAGAAEQRVGELAQRLAAVSVELDALRARLAQLAEAPPAGDPPAIVELGVRTGQLADQLRALQERVGAAEQAQDKGGAERARAAAFAVGVAELDSVARAGRPFAATVNAVRALVPDAATAELLQPLEPYAASGVATLERLKRDWPEAARRAKAAQVAADYGRDYGGWLGRVMAFLESAVTIRRIGADVPGDDAEALLARAGARLEADDLTGALATLASLPEPAARAAKRWLDQARARRDVETALAQLTERALGAVARAGG
jgi:uroporphyrinogen-III synthase